MKTFFQYLIVIAVLSSVTAFAAKGGGQSVESVSNDKFLNVRVNPLGLAFGALSAEGDFKINDKWTLGPSVSYFSANMIFTELSGFGIGARSNFYLTGNTFEDSWIVGTTLGVSFTSVRLGTQTASSTGAFLNAVFGYQWVWKNGINLQLGLGGAWYSQGSDMALADGTQVSVPYYHGIKPSAEFTVGYVF